MSARRCCGLLAQLERAGRPQAEERPRLLAEFGGHLHVLEALRWK